MDKPFVLDDIRKQSNEKMINVYDRFSTMV
jgi:hypothetical protein